MHSNKLNSSVSFLKLTFGASLLALVLGLPSGITAWFDGLPWTGKTETLVLSVIIPFFLILGWRFLSLRKPVALLSLLLVLKLILFLASPSGGWLVRVTPGATLQTSEHTNWIKTYASFWSKDASGILQKPWSEKLDFPLDWALFNMSCSTCFETLTISVEVDGALLLPAETKFALIANGVEEGTLSAVNENGERFNLLLAKNFEEAGRQTYQLLQGGRWKISGKLRYAGLGWSLIPVLINPDGEINSDLNRGILWQSDEGLKDSRDYIGIIKVFSLFTDCGIILFLLTWAIWTVKILIERKILSWPLAIFSMLAVCVPFATASLLANVFKIVKLSDPTSISYLGVSSFTAAAGFLFWVWWKKDTKSFQKDKIVHFVFTFFGPALLFYFSNKWWHSLGQWKNWGVGDDWNTYQMYARKIIVDGQWLNAGENIFIMQPLYRYFVGVYHLLFGQSTFVQNMADVWCLLGVTTLLASWALKLRQPALIAFSASISYLTITFLGGFRYHIGRGLVEYHAMFFMVLAGWLLYRAREGSFLKVLLAGFFGVIGYWIRQDHLIVIVALVFFIVEPTHGTTKVVWMSYWEQIQTYWKRGFTYIGIMSLGVFLMCFRNWWVGGVFGPTVPGHPNYTQQDLTTFYQRIRVIVTAVDHGNPSFSTIILLTGTLVGLIALIWRPKPLQNYPLAIGIALIGLFLPYWFVANWAYAPRYSIHLLPLAIVSLMIVGSYYLKNKMSPP
ncbi:hypothetical protein N9L33_01330 [Nitrospinae bacterium]|nr:hypothetical protein [Nitrospinota bacterium]